MLAPSRRAHPLRLFFTLLLIAGQLVGLMPLPQAQARVAAPFPAVEPTGASTKELHKQPLDLQYALSKQLGLDDASYHLNDDGAALNAANARQGMRTTFDNLGMQISSDGYGWGIELAGLGRGATLEPIAPGVQGQPEANRVEFDHGPLTSWYVNGPLGVQQGWTLRKRPEGAFGQPLTLALLQSGNLQGRLAADKRGLELVDETGTQRLSYDGLVAFDANGKDLPVWLELADACSVAVSSCSKTGEQPLTQLPIAQIHVDDAGAVYPLTIDPWVQGVRLTASDAATNGGFTYAVASDDGKTVVVSATQDDQARGAVYVFVRVDDVWVNDTEVAKLIETNGVADNLFGSAVAISGDGNTIVVNSANADKVYLFQRPTSGWVDASSSIQLIGSTSPSPAANFGYSVAINHNGATVVVSAPSTGGSQGAIYIYERPTGGWSTAQTEVARVNHNIADSYFGQALDISGDGSTITVGASGTSGTPGEVYIYNRPGASWSGISSHTLQLSPGNPYIRFGTDLALSADGSTLAVLAGQGSYRVDAFVYQRAANGWTSTAPTATLTNTAFYGWSNASLTINTNGTVFAVKDGNYGGLVSTYRRSSDSWGSVTPERFYVEERSAALSGDGGTLFMAGGDVVNVYTTPNPVPQLNTLSQQTATFGDERFALSLYGADFVRGATVNWGGTTITPTSVTSTTLVVTVTSDLLEQTGYIPVRAVNPLPGGGASTPVTFTVQNPVPILASISPAQGFANEPAFTITAEGNNFTRASAIHWNGTPISTTFVSSNMLTATVNAARFVTSGTYSVSVVTSSPGGGSSGTQTFTAQPAPPPTLIGISPFARAAGKPSFTLTAVGSNFMQRSQIVWNGQPLATTYVNSATLTAQISTSLIENEGSIDVTVGTSTPGGGTSSGQQFNVTSANPSLADVYPFYGTPVGGAEVTLSGMNLESTSAVTFGLRAATILTRTETELVVRAPFGPIGSADVTVKTRYGTATLNGGYVYAASEPAQPWRDFGLVRVWANTFTTTNGTTVASGRVSLGHATRNARYYRVSQEVSWVTSDTLTISGTLGFFGGDSLAAGQFKLVAATGAITPQPGTLTLLERLGDTNIAINPRLTLNALDEQVPVAAALVVSLPENPSLGLQAHYRLSRDGTINPIGTMPLTLRLAGATLNADVQVANVGLTAPSARLGLARSASLSLPAITINDSGLRIGSGAVFSLPNIELDGDVLKLNNLQARLEVVGDSYALPLAGTLLLAGLPEANNRALPMANLRVADGVVQGNVGNFDLTMGGAPLVLRGAMLQFTGERYQLVAENSSWSLPAAWASGSRPQVAINDVTLNAETPFLHFAQTSRFSIPGAFALGGATDGRNSVQFDQLRAELRVDDSRWAVDLSSDITIRLGKQSGGTTFTNVPLSIVDDHISGVLDNARLSVAGLPLLASLQYRDTTLSADQATLTLPSRWNRVQVNTGGFVFTPDELRLGPAVFGPAGGQPTFAIPTIPLGVLAFSNNTASLLVDSSNAYQLAISSTLAIDKVGGMDGVAPRAAANLLVRAGRVSGTVPDLDFKLSGFDLSARNLQVIDNMVKTDVVTLTMPPRLGKARTTLYGLEVGGARGFSVRGGKFKLPDFKMGTVGVQNVTAEFIKDGDEYVLGAEGRLEFTKINVEGAFKVAYNSSSSSVQVRRLMIAFEGKIPSPAVPIANSGLYFTRISGEFSLDDGTMTIELGTRISTPTEIAGESMLYMDASVTFQLRPSFEFRANADLYVIGLRAAYAELRIWGSGFSTKGAVQLGILRIGMEITFGTDTWNEFTFYGRISADVIIPKGYITTWPLNIPSEDLKLASAALEGGKFSKGNERFWGARGAVTVLEIFSVSAMLRLGKGGGISLNKSIWEYQPVRPIGALALSQSDAPRDTFVFTATNAGRELALIETLTTTQRANGLSLEIRSPYNVPFTATLAYTETDKSFRIYKVTVNKPEDMRGLWTIKPALGNLIVPMGLIPPPEFRQAQGCLVGGACLNPSGATLLTAGQAVDLNWDAGGFTPGLTLDLFATDSNGERSYITTTTTSALTLTGTTRWTPALASGSYTLTAMLVDETGAPVQQNLGVLVYSDTEAPAAPQGLQVLAQRDLSVLLSWNGAAAEADVLGYQIAVDDGEPIRKDDKLSSLRSAGLAPGSTHRFAVAAYDRSGNVGEASVVTATMPLLGLSGNWPVDGSVDTNTAEVGASFSGIVSGTVLTVTNTAGVVVPGVTTPITSEVLLDALAASTPTLAADLDTGIGAVENGAIFVPATGPLPSGRYTATISAWDFQAQEQVVVSWSFEVVQPEQRVHFPLFLN